MGIADATENDGEDAVTPMKCFTAQDRAKLDRRAVVLARETVQSRDGADMAGGGGDRLGYTIRAGLYPAAFASPARPSQAPPR
jgi:hypothetical protein